MLSHTAHKFRMHLEMGNRALSVGDLLSAQSEYVAALALNRDCLQAAQNLSVVFLQSERVELAVAMAENAVRIEPASHEVWNNLGYMLGTAVRFTECEAALRRSLELCPSAPAYHSLGLALYSLGRWAESVEAFDRQLELQPGNRDAIDKRSISLLGMGRYREGLIDNKIRWECVAAHPLMHSSIPEWNGESLVGKTIMVLHEQGFGDTLQFIRFLPRLKSEFGARRVILSVPTSIIDLFRLAGVADEVVGIRDIPEGGADYKSPMMTVPAHLGVTVQTIPGEPYLLAPARAPSLPMDGRIKVGMVWAGKPMYAQDRWRSINIMELLPLVTMGGDVSFYSLQVDERAQDLWRSGMNAFVTDLTPGIKDWSDTAAIIDELDLLVSVDTAPAHLAGAMGKPVALMIPEASCWRWLDHDTTTTPWYPSMRLFRQQRQGDWGPVIAGVRDYIAELSSGHIANSLAA